MAGLTTAAMLGIGGAVLGAGASLYGTSQANANAGRAQALSSQQAAMQAALQQQMLQQQREFQTATTTDAEGNKLVYDSNQGWIPLLSDRGRIDLAATQGAQDIERTKYFGRGQYEDQQAFQRRFGEGQQANALLTQMRQQAGAPTREGVIGKSKVAAATGASEPADLIKSGGALANLRTGGSASALNRQFEALDPNVSQGLRTKLAAADASGNSNYIGQKTDWLNSLLTPYKAFAGGAQPPNPDVPQSPGTEALSAQVASRASKPYSLSPGIGYGSNMANSELMKAIGMQQQPNYGGVIASLTSNLQKLFPPSTTPAGGTAP